jgi:hypothetical protein
MSVAMAVGCLSLCFVSTEPVAIGGTMGNGKVRQALVIVVLLATLVTWGRADTLKSDGEKIVVGIVAVTATLAVVATVLIIHYSKKKSITGCVVGAGGGMTLTNEKDKQLYALSGNTSGIKAGERMQLQGRKAKSKAVDSTLVWETKLATKDFGTCEP